MNSVRRAHAGQLRLALPGDDPVGLEDQIEEGGVVEISVGEAENYSDAAESNQDTG